MFKHILVAIDGSAPAMRDAGRKMLVKAESIAGDRGIEVQSILVESLGVPVARAILRQARKQKADLIVLGTHGRRGIRRILLGSEAETVLRKSPVPVLLVRADESARSSSRGLLSKPGVIKRTAVRPSRSRSDARS